MAGAQAQIAAIHHGRAIIAGAATGHGHHFAATGHDQVFHTGHDRGGSEIDHRNARAAEAVEGHAAGAHIIASIQSRHPAQIAALRAALRAGAPDHIADISGIDIVTLGQGLEHGCTQLLGVNIGKGTLANLANPARGADGIDNPGFTHDSLPVF